MLLLRFRRPDGSYVVDLNGLPYHVTADDRYFEMAEAAALLLGDDLPFEPPPPEPELTALPERAPTFLAQVRLRITADVVEGLSTDGGLSSCSVLEPGLLWCDFPSPIVGEYLVWPSNGATHRCYSLPEEQFPEGFAVRAQSYDGQDTFPPALQILVTKS